MIYNLLVSKANLEYKKKMILKDDLDDRKEKETKEESKG
jgi:hypothetical protein